jgi:hypothetical protein
VKKYFWPAVVILAAGTFLALNAVVPHIYRNLVGPLLPKLWHLILFGALWLAAYFAGKGLLRVVGYREALPPELAVAAGIAVFSVAALALAAIHLAYGLIVKIVTVGVLAAGFYPWARRLRLAPARVRRWLAELELGPAAWIFFGGLLAFPLVLAAAQPPLYWDALTYHLAVPQKYAAAHGFVYLSQNIYSSMPLGATMFYLWGILWDGLTCANASYFGASLLVIALVYRLARLWLPQFYAAAAAFMVFFSPVFFVVMPGAHVDHFLMAYAASALYVYFLPGDEVPIRRPLAAGIFLGAALAVKYTSIYVLGAFAPVLVYDLFRRRLRWRDVAVMLGVAFAFVAPWLVKAYVERGNPLFPLFYEVLGGRDFSQQQAEHLVAWQHTMGAGRSWYDFLLLPYRISVRADFDYGYFAGIYLPYLMPLAVIAAVAFRRAGRLVAFAWAFVACWSVGPQQLRFLDGGLAALAIAASGSLAAGEAALRGAGRVFWKWGVAALIIYTGLAYNVGGVLHTLEGYDYLAGESREQFLETKCGFYLAQKFINEHTPADAKILMMFTNHTLYLKRAAVYDSFFEASAFLLAAENGADAAGLYELARRWGVTHVHIFHLFEQKTWPYYSKRTKIVFYEFVEDYCRPVYRDPLNDVYELSTAE